MLLTQQILNINTINNPKNIILNLMYVVCIIFTYMMGFDKPQIGIYIVVARNINSDWMRAS